MNWLANLRLRTKLISAFSVVLVLTLLLGMFANAKLSNVHDQNTELAENWLPSVTSIGELNDFSSDVQRFTLRHVLSANADAKRGLEQDIQKRQEAFRSAEQAYAPLLSSEEEKAKWAETSEKKHRAQFKARSLKPDKKTWTPTDISFEFSDRVNSFWHIPPWRVTQTRFRMILADMRRRHDTNGFIEYSMIDIFFETEPILEFKNADYVMMRFFYRFPMLLSNVRERGLDLNELERIQAKVREEERVRRGLERLLDS